MRPAVIGGYPAFYEETRYDDAASGRLLSKIQPERAHPAERLDAIARCPSAGKTAASSVGLRALVPRSRAQCPDAGDLDHFLRLAPWTRAPHQFDVSDNRLYESCKGTYRGEPAHTRLWEDDLIEL